MIEMFLENTEIGNQLYQIEKMLGFRFFPSDIMSHSKREISVLIGMINKYNQEKQQT